MTTLGIAQKWLRSFTPDFSQVILRRKEIGNRLNGFPGTWLKLPPG